MALFFLIPLFTGLISAYIFFKKCTDEIGYLVGIFAVVCLILSLVLAPWQILLLLLMFILNTTKRLLRQNEYKLKLVEDNHDKLNQSEKKDPLSFKHRNTEVKDIPKYQFSSDQGTQATHEITQGGVAEKYLDTPLRIHTISRNA